VPILPSGLFLQVFLINAVGSYSLPRASRISWSFIWSPYNICLRRQVMKLLIIPFRTTSCHFLSLGSRYTPQYPVCGRPESIFFSVKVKFSLCLINYHIVKMYEGVEVGVKLHALLTSTLDGGNLRGEWWLPVQFNRQKKQLLYFYASNFTCVCNVGPHEGLLGLYNVLTSMSEQAGWRHVVVWECNCALRYVEISHNEVTKGSVLTTQWCFVFILKLVSLCSNNV
jgi:hypothetical protein